MRLLRPFGPEAFPTFNVWRVDSTSSGVRIIEFNCVWYAGGVRGGSIAFCSFRMVWLWKWSFRRLALSISLVYTLPFDSRGGISECVWGEINALRVDHQSFEDRFSDLSFCVILSVCCCLQFLISVVTSLRSLLNFAQWCDWLVALAFL